MGKLGGRELVQNVLAESQYSHVIIGYQCHCCVLSGSEFDFDSRAVGCVLPPGRNASGLFTRHRTDQY